jgi:hypothetical protein
VGDGDGRVSLRATSAFTRLSHRVLA